MKLCPKCKTEKSRTEFNKNRTKQDGLSIYCRYCNKLYLKKHYNKNKDYYKTKAQRFKRKISKRIKELKENSPCTDCKKFFHFSAMDFDHIRRKKKGEISSLKQSVSIQKLIEEMNKCELVCACCHRIRTWNRKNNAPVV